MTDRSTRLTAVLAAIVAVLAVVAVFVTSYRGGSDSNDTESSDNQRVGGEPAPAGPEDEDGPTEQPPDEGGDPAHPPEAPDPEVITEIQETATRFLQAWSEPGNAQERTKAIGPYATRSLTQQLSEVDSANLPSGELRGDPEVKGGAQSTATADAAFDGGPRVRCELVLGPDGWMVSRLLPLQEGEDQSGQGGQERGSQGDDQQDDGQQDDRQDQRGQGQNDQEQATEGA